MTLRDRLLTSEDVAHKTLAAINGSSGASKSIQGADLIRIVYMVSNENLL